MYSKSSTDISIGVLGFQRNDDILGHVIDCFHPKLFQPRSHSLFGEEEIEFDAEEVEDICKDDIRQCTRDLLLVERAKEWLLDKGKSLSPAESKSKTKWDER